MSYSRPVYLNSGNFNTLRVYLYLTLSYNCHLSATSHAIVNALLSSTCLRSASSHSFLHGTQVSMSQVVSFPCFSPLFWWRGEASWTKVSLPSCIVCLLMDFILPTNWRFFWDFLLLFFYFYFNFYCILFF